MLIFLGLLGTFYGLATTVPALVDTIRGLAPQEGEDGVEVFSRLMTGLEGQLGGMGVAFASSLLGLAGSLVVGLLELFASHGQNRFYRELEEWMSTITRVGYAGSEGEGAGGSDAMGGVLDHMNAQMDGLQSLMERSEQARIAADTRMAQLATAVEHLASRMGTTDNDILARIAEGQERLVEVLGARDAGDGLDAESRMRLRSIDVQMLRILEEISAGRQESMTELRTDLASLTRAIERGRGGR